MARILTPDEITRAQGDNTFEQLGKGIFVGATQDPFIGGLIKSLGQIAGVDSRGLEEMEHQLQGRTAAEIGKFVGEFGPSLLFGAGAFSAGKAAGTAGIRAIARGAVGRAGAEAGAEGGVAAMAAKGTQAAAKEVVEVATRKGLLSNQFGLIVDKANDVAGGLQKIQGTPALQRVSEIAGGNLSIGGLVYGQEKARGKNDVDALKSAGLAVVLGVGLEGGLTTIGKQFGRGKSFRVSDIEKKFHEVGPGQVDSPGAIIVKEMEAGINRVGKLKQELSKLTDVESQVIDLESAQGALATLKSNQSKIKDIRQEIGLTRSQIKVNHHRLTTQGSNAYTNSDPAHPGLFQNLANRIDPTNRFRSSVTSAPEAFAGDFGASGNRIMTPLLGSLHNADANIRIHEGTLSHLSERARRALGFKEKEWVKDTVDLHDAFVLRGEAGVRDYARSRGRSSADIEDLVGVMKEVEEGNFNVLQVRGVPVGLRGQLDLNEFGVVKYLPKVGQNLNEIDLTNQLLKAGRSPDEIIEFINRSKQHLDEHVPLGGVTGKGARLHGSLDFDRVRKGGLRDGLNEGIPYNKNLFDASLRVRVAAERRIALDPHIGRKGDQISTLTAAVKAEGGDAIRFETILNSLSQRKYYDEAMRKSAAAFTGAEVATKLTTAVFPNMTQSINTMISAGVKQSLKGLWNLTRAEDRNTITQMQGIHSQFIKGISRSWDSEGLVAGPVEKLADWTLRYTGFNYVERFNRMHSGMTHLAVINDTLAKGYRQKLRGTLLDSRRKMFGDMGLDLDVLTRKIDTLGTDYLQSEEFKKMAFLGAVRGSQKTQFFAGSTRTPTGWRHPLGRVLSQFKSFALGQSRFLRDGVLIEAANGNLRPMVTLMSLAPIAGEAVGNVKDMIKGKDRDSHGYMRAFNNISYVGGAGLFSDLFTSARYGNLEGFILGPTLTDMTTVAEALLSGEPQRLLKQAQRLPIYQAGKFLLGAGTGTIEEIDEYLDTQLGSGSEETRSFLDVGQLKTQRIQQKRPQTQTQTQP